MRTVTLVVRVPAADNGNYMAKVRQVVTSLAEFDLRVHLFIEQGDNPVILVQGDVIDLKKTSVRDIIRRILSYTSAEVSDPDMLEKLAGAGINESGELVLPDFM